MEGLNIQYPNQVRKKNKSLPSPPPPSHPVPQGHEGSKQWTPKSYIPKTYEQLQTFWYENLWDPSVLPFVLVPVLPAKHGLCSKTNFLGCTASPQGIRTKWSFLPSRGQQLPEAGAWCGHLRTGGPRQKEGRWGLVASRLCLPLHHL